MSNLDDTIYYNNKFVPKNNFRVCLYDSKNNKKITNNYAEYNRLINTGIWSEKKNDLSKVEAKESDNSFKKAKGKSLSADS